jgi:hypothetical protein
MLFSEYCKLRCRGGGISSKEVKLLGIDKKKGWMKRYADLEIDGKTLHRLIAIVVSNRNASSCLKSKLMDIQKNYTVDDKQMLYLMRSEVGNLKIGISKDPISRARDITNASGLVVECIAYWKLDRIARQIEQHLHKTFKRHRLQGEWFLPHFQIHHVEEGIPCSYERLFFNEQAASKIDVYQPTSVKKDKLSLGGEEFKFTKIKHETDKALLVEDGEELFWVAKSRINQIDKVTGIIHCKYGTTVYTP